MNFIFFFNIIYFLTFSALKCIFCSLPFCIHPSYLFFHFCISPSPSPPLLLSPSYSYSPCSTSSTPVLSTPYTTILAHPVITQSAPPIPPPITSSDPLLSPPLLPTTSCPFTVITLHNCVVEPKTFLFRPLIKRYTTPIFRNLHRPNPLHSILVSTVKNQHGCGVSSPTELIHHHRSTTSFIL